LYIGITVTIAFKRPQSLFTRTVLSW